MASPQKENGYTAIANEILESLARIRIAGEARQVVDVIFRKTYGYQKKEDSISLSQFCSATGMRRTDICRAIRKALFMQIISKKATGSITKYSINKDFDQWRPLAKKLRGSLNCLLGSSKKANNRKQKSYIQKKVTKESITKENTAKSNFAEKEFEKPNKEIPELIDLFKSVNPSYQKLFANKTQRGAIERMLKVHGYDVVSSAIESLLKSNRMEYMPVVTTPLQLEDKWGALFAAWQKAKNKEPLIL